VKALAPSASFHFEGKFASWDESMQALYKWFSPPKYKVVSRDKSTGKGAGKGDGKGNDKGKGGDGRGRGGQAGRGVATTAALMAPALTTSTPVDSHFFSTPILSLTAFVCAAYRPHFSFSCACPPLGEDFPHQVWALPFPYGAFASFRRARFR
jgi:hypothetical protein